MASLLEPVKDRFFELAEPELNLNGNEAIDVSHISHGQSITQAYQQNAARHIGRMQKQGSPRNRNIPAFASQNAPEHMILRQTAAKRSDDNERKP